MSKAIIGIDLGTTNSTISVVYQDLLVKTLEIEQLCQNGSLLKKLQLPSFVYFPLSEELEKFNSSLVVGEFAKERGKEVPDRVIQSAKSWLCHHLVDRRSKLLPLDLPEAEVKISPLDASSFYLKALKKSFEDIYPDLSFSEQEIIITTPASFDPAARQLVEEAAHNAGFPKCLLIEEPQAAFYAWLSLHEEEWRKVLSVGDSVLVIDIGGGTSDFSVIAVNDFEGNLQLERVAVGDHLLLGGDNIDLAIAYLARQKIEEKTAIDDWQMNALTYAARSAKEALLGENAPESQTLTIPGRGRKLIGGAISTTITKKEVEDLIVEGFLPFISLEKCEPIVSSTGLKEAHLPFAEDPRLSYHLGSFLKAVKAKDGSVKMPTHVLFNGGTMKAFSLRKRMLELLNKWSKELNEKDVIELDKPDYDFAVSRGAAYYGLSRAGKGIRIKSATALSYYVGVQESGLAVPGMPPRFKAICIAPRGMEEGREEKLDGEAFSLTLNELACFRFFSENGGEAQLGQIERRIQDKLTEIHPIETVLHSNDAQVRSVQVKLRSKVTETGSLELWCDAENEQSWKLEFDLRK